MARRVSSGATVVGRVSNPPSGRLWKAALLLVLAAALFLRVYRLDGQSLWADEGNSAALAGRPFAVIAVDAAADIHPPLYYFCLRLWAGVFGTSEVALRALSVLWSLLLVAAVHLLAERTRGRRVALLAAGLAALAPFGIYYSQEARMYMMLAALAALAALAGWRITGTLPLALDCQVQRIAPGARAGLPNPAPPGGFGNPPGAWRSVGWPLLYVAASVAGLYTHYFFPTALLAINAAYLTEWLLRRGWRAGWTSLARWLGLHIPILLLYLPWLATGLSRLFAWPAGSAGLNPIAWLELAWRTLCLGPAAVAWPWAAVAFAVVAVAGAVAAFLPSPRPSPEGRGCRHSPLPSGEGPGVRAALGWLIPIVVMLASGIYSPARLKFLLIASPFLCLTLADGILAGFSLLGRAGWRRFAALAWAILAGLALLVPTVASLQRYYFDPSAARDDYRGAAAYIAAVGRPGDAILLNAPGQWDVFSYYYRGTLPIYRLPEQRPPNAAALQSRLAEISAGGGRLFVLYWATDESDPGRLMENWLDTHAFKGVESWVGNVRFVVYATPAYGSEDMQEMRPGLSFESALRLEQVAWSRDPVAAGDLLPIAFTWRVVNSPAVRLKLFAQVLDAGNHIVGQRDAGLAGGRAGDLLSDRQAVLIEPGTPPGRYRLIAGLYETDNGRRLTVAESGVDAVELGWVTVERPATPLPLAALSPIFHAGQTVGPLRLIGYDRYELGQPRTPAAPLAAGKPLHLSLYWQAQAAPAGDWAYRLWLGKHVWQDWSPIGGAYATGTWAAGEIVRDQIDLFLPADLPAGSYRLRLELRRPDSSEAQGSISLGSVTVR